MIKDLNYYKKIYNKKAAPKEAALYFWEQKRLKINDERQDFRLWNH